jgi:hypothetical protein
MSVHAVEFSKTVAPLQEGNPPQGYARIRFRNPGRTDKYSAPPADLENIPFPARRRAARGMGR